MNPIAVLMTSLSSGAPFGLGTAAGWGISDYVATQATRRFPFSLLSMLVLTSAAATLVLTVALPGGLYGVHALFGLRPLALLLMGCIAVLESGGRLLLYVAFARGPLALVAPLANGSPAVAALLAIAFGYRPSLLLLLGAGLLFTSAVFASVERPEPRGSVQVTIPSATTAGWLLADSRQGIGQGLESTGILHSRPIIISSMRVSPRLPGRFPPVPHATLPWKVIITPGVTAALLAALLQGVGLFLLGFLPHSVSSEVSTWLIYVGGTVFLMLVGGALALWGVAQRWQRGSRHHAAQQRSIPGKRKWIPMRVWAQLLTVGSLDAFAFLCFTAGQHASQPVLTAALASLSAVVTVALAVMFLHDRLSKQQWVGVGCAVVGLLLAGIPSAL